MGPSILGVLGGMGPLSSARFVDTLYRRHLARPEQQQPMILLRSNPQILDRTRALQEGRHAELAAAIGHELGLLQAAGATHLVICCVTAHAVWEALPAPLLAHTRSLLDVLFEAPALADRPRLVVCTTATRRLGLLERHPAFARSQGQLLFADAPQQAELHELIYALKRGEPAASVLPRLGEIARGVGARGLVAACTEIHLLEAPPADLDLLDPLALFADALETFLSAGERANEHP